MNGKENWWTQLSPAMKIVVSVFGFALATLILAVLIWFVTVQLLPS